MRPSALFACVVLSADCAPPASAPVHVEAPTAPSEGATAAVPDHATPEAPFRATPPPLPRAEALRPPPIRTFRLSNGIRVLFVEQHALGLLSVAVTVKAGARALGASDLAIRTMWYGTSSRSYDQVRITCDAELAQSWAWSAAGMMSVGIVAPSDQPDAAIALLGDVAMSPSFPAPMVQRELAAEIHKRAPGEEAPATTAARVLPMALFGWKHPDDEDWALRSEDVSALSRADVVSAYEHSFDPSVATILAAGDSTEEALRPMLERVFGPWRSLGRHLVAPRARSTVATASPRFVFVDRPGSPQAFVLFGGAGPAAWSSDWEASLFMAEIYSGGDGRLLRALRGSGFATTDGGLYLTSSTDGPRTTVTVEVPLEQTAAVLHAVEGDLRTMSADERFDTELEDVRDRRLRAQGSWLLTTQQEIELLRRIVAFDLPSIRRRRWARSPARSPPPTFIASPPPTSIQRG